MHYYVCMKEGETNEGKIILVRKRALLIGKAFVKKKEGKMVEKKKKKKKKKHVHAKVKSAAEHVEETKKFLATVNVPGHHDVKRGHSSMYLQAQAVNKARMSGKEKVKRERSKKKRPESLPGGRLKDLGYQEELVDIWTSASRGDLKAVEHFVSKGHNLNMQPGCYPNGTILHEAVQNGHIAIVRFLIEKGCDVNAVDDVLNTALHRAARFAQTDIIRVLLNARAHPDPINDMERTPWELAKLNGNEGAAALLPIGDLTNIAAMLQMEEKLAAVLSQAQPQTE